MWSWASTRGQGARGPRVSTVPKGRESSPLPAFPPPEKQSQKEEEGGEVRAPGSQSRVSRGPRKQGLSFSPFSCQEIGAGVTLVWTGRGAGRGDGLSVGGRSRQPERGTEQRAGPDNLGPVSQATGHTERGTPAEALRGGCLQPQLQRRPCCQSCEA